MRNWFLIFDTRTRYTSVTLHVFEDVMQVTVKFGENLLVLNKISVEIMGRELKSLIRTRLGSLMAKNTRFQVRSQINGRFLRDNKTLEQVFRGFYVFRGFDYALKYREHDFH